MERKCWTLETLEDNGTEILDSRNLKGQWKGNIRL